MSPKGATTPNRRSPLPNGTGLARQTSSDSVTATSMTTSSTTEQHSSQHTENSSTVVITASEAYEVEDSSERFEKYIQLGVRGLRGCQLTLKGTSLTIKWSVPDNLHDKGETTVDLDIHVATINGKLVWGRGGGGFSKKCKNIRLKGVVLIASCPVDLGGSVGAGGYIDAELDLNDHFAFSRDGFQPNIPDTEFEAFISAASWMNLTVISEANMCMFLQHPAFQKAITSVVRRSVEVSNIQTLAVVQQMVQKLETINKSTEEYISLQMAAFVKSAVASSAAYATMSQLTTMMAGSKERTTFDAFIETTHHSTRSAGEIPCGGAGEIIYGGAGEITYGGPNHLISSIPGSIYKISGSESRRVALMVFECPSKSETWFPECHHGFDGNEIGARRADVSATDAN
ncbi:hypothetical protein K438DRAFT_2099731 [Mycena galopus ATCC 62051]|nr:hypothetical protein K438DRAFT_2099731 [Mycena galopus ATCC 62051]